MADVNKLAPIIFGWEGTWANDPVDMGGATMMGVTFETWKSCGYDKDGDHDIDIADLKLITKSDVVDYILKPHYWDRWKADKINNQSIANILVDFVWASGKWGIIKIQQMLDLKADGMVGDKTLFAINNYVKQEDLFNQIQQVRRTFVANIVLAHPEQKKFERGWLNRINSFKFAP